MALRDDVTAFLREHGLRLNTELGQHFLVDDAVLENIMDIAEVEEGDQVVEIGPGIGILTQELLTAGAHVTAIELDERLIPLLRKYTNNDARLTAIQGNALHVSPPNRPYKVVANIPYHITSPLLRHLFLESETRPTTMTLLIQREVAETICDPESAGILTIVVGLFGEPHIVCKVGKNSFLPPPAVESAVLHIRCFSKPLADMATIERIFSLTKIAFGQKRKMLRNTIGGMPGGFDALARVGIEATRRPQTLTVKEWIGLAGAFS